MYKKGFTLIEVLVIILIIGVLAAVAMPIYTNAVAQSRFSALMPSVKALKDAQERVFLSSSKYSDSFEELDLSVAGTVVQDKLVSGDEVFSLENSSSDSTAKNAIIAQHEKLPNINLVMYLARSPNFAEDVHCEAKASDEKANHLCQLQNENMIGTRDGYNVYLVSGSGEGKLNSWPKQGECQTFGQYQGCSRYTNEDGSYYEAYWKNGNYFEQFFDKDGNKYYATQMVSADGTKVEAWFEDGNRVKQTQTYSDGRVATWEYAPDGTKTAFEAVDKDGNLLQKAEYNDNGTYDNYYWYENGNLKQQNTYDENGVQTGTTTYWSNNPGKVQFYNTYENGEYVAQTKYWPDGSVRGYYEGNLENATFGVEYNQDGSIRISEEYSSPGVADKTYFYNPDGTWVSKPNLDPSAGEFSGSSTDESTWVYGTYTTDSNGNINRSDGVVIPGSNSYPNLCTAHPEQPQCAG